MVASKTRIWRGGLAEIMRGSQAVEAPRELCAEATAPESVSERLSEASAPRAVQPSAAQRSARSNHPTLVGHLVDLRVIDQAPRSKAMSTTRVVPIESLLVPTPSKGSHEEPEPQASGPEPRDEPGFSALLARMLPRKLEMVHLRRGAMALLALFVLGTWSLRGRESAVASKHAQATSQRAAPVEQTAGSALAPLRPQLSEASAGGAPRPRSAVDALASGDYVAAQRLYAELAQQVEGRSAYSEAARILAERLESKSER